MTHTRIQRPSRHRTVMLVLASIMGAGLAFAQQAAPAPAASGESPKPVDPQAIKPATTATNNDAAAAEDETIVLSPFVIEANSDQGYAATQSLAGSRLKTELKDIANQIDILTPEFMQDIQAFDSDDAFKYSINTENSYELGGTGTQFFGESSSTSASANNRTRGLDGATNTRNFFRTNFPKDNYNIGNRGLTIAGGPNAILFGQGSPAGIADSTEDEANVNNTKSTVTISVDSNDTRRYSLKHNQVILKNRLAMTVALLDSDKRFFTKPNFERDKRAYGNIVFKLTKDIQLSTSAEYMDRLANRPVLLLPKDSVSVWTNPGGHNSAPFLTPGAAPSTTLTSPYSGLVSADQAPIYVYGSGVTTPAVYSARYTAQLKSVGQFLTTTGVAPGINNFSTDSTLIDERYYPFNKYNHYGETHPAAIEGKRFTQSLQGRLIKDLFFELAGNYEYTKQISSNFFVPTQANISVDPNFYRFKAGFIPTNSLTPTSTPVAATPAQWLLSAQNPANYEANPNFGDLYVEGYQTGGKSDALLREARFSLAYQWSARKQFGNSTWSKVLGSHRFSSNTGYNDFTLRSQDNFQRLIKDNGVDPVTGFGIAPSVVTATNARDDGTNKRYMLGGTNGGGAQDHNRRFRTRAYIDPNDPNARFDTGGGLDPFGDWVFQDGSGNPYTVSLFNAGGAASLARGRRTQNISNALTWQGSLLNDYLVLTYGRRTDKFRLKEYDNAAKQRSLRTGLFPTYETLPWGRFGEDTEKTNTTKAAVLKLFPGKWLRFHYNESTNNQAEPPAVYDITGLLHALPEGINRDYGVSIDITDRLSLRLNSFDNQSTSSDAGNTYGNNTLRTQIVTLESRFVDLMTNRARALSLPDFDGYYGKTATQPGFDTSILSAPAGDPYRIYADNRSRGLEITLSGKLTDKLDIRVSAGRTQSIKTKVGVNWRNYAIDPETFARMDSIEHYNANGLPITGYTAANAPIVGAPGATPVRGWKNVRIADSGTTANQTMFQYYQLNVLKSALFVDQLDGIANPAIREWRANATLAYNFAKGWRGGFSVRMRERALVGYRNEPVTVTIQTPSGPEVVTTQVSNLDRPYFNDRLWYFDPFISYTTKIGRNVKVRAQLNVDNLLDESDIYPTGIVASSSNNFNVNTPLLAQYGWTDSQAIYNSYSLGEPRVAKFTLTFDF